MVRLLNPSFLMRQSVPSFEIIDEDSFCNAIEPAQVNMRQRARYPVRLLRYLSQIHFINKSKKGKIR